MSNKFLTVIYDMSRPGMQQKASLLLLEADWTASGWSHAFADRDEARKELYRLQESIAAAPQVVADERATCPDCEGRGFNYGEIAYGGDGFMQPPDPPTQESCEVCEGSGIAPPDSEIIAPVQAQHSDDIAVDRCAAAMKAKLASSRAKGRGGWDDPAQCSIASLSALLRAHVDKGDPLDVANIAMLIQQRGGSIPAPVQAQEPVALLTLGGIDGDEYGDNDLELVSSKAVEKLQAQLVRGQNPVVLELFAHSAPVQPVAVPDGWKLVPIEPTDAMAVAAIKVTLGNPAVNGVDQYRAMLAAAPATPAAQGDDKDEAYEFAARVIELFDDATMRHDHMLDAGECATVIRALKSTEIAAIAAKAAA